MKRTDLTKIDWNKIQNEHNNGVRWTQIPIVFNISMTVLKRAERDGYIKKILHKVIHDKKTKNTISVKRKEFLKNNPDKHFWRNVNKFKSIQCEILKIELENNDVSFVEEYKPILGRSFRIDIAFPDKKIGIEINGNQHYDNRTTLKKYYQDRKNIIEANGWSIFDIHYKKVYDKDFIQSFINTLKNDYDLKQIDYSCYIVKKEKKIILKRSEYFDNVREQNFNNVHKHRIEIVKNSGIDFSKFGWAKKVSELIDLIPQKVKGWMIQFMPEFYEEKCYKKIDRFGLSKVKKYGSNQEYLKCRKEQSLEITNKRIELIKNNNMSLSEKGWSVKLSELLNINRSHICKWFKKNKEYVLQKIEKQ